MFISKEEMIASWESMINDATEAGVKVILITPAIDCGEIYYDETKRKLSDEEMNDIITELAKKHDVALAEVHNHFKNLLACGHLRDEYTASWNHINRNGHEVVADEMMKWFGY